MPLPALLPLLGTGLGYLGQAAASPLGQAAIGSIAPSLLGGISNWWNGPQQPGPEQQAGQYYLNQIQQPINIPYQAQQQQLMNQFNTQFLPQLHNQYAGLGAGETQNNLFGQAQGAAGADLFAQLEALRERSQLQQQEQMTNRLGQLGGYLGGQQRLGLEAQDLAQRGAIANREAQLRAMGLMGGQNEAQMRNSLQQLLGRGELQGRLAGLGLGQQFDTIRHGGQPGFAGQAAQAGLNAGINYFGGR